MSKLPNNRPEFPVTIRVVDSAVPVEAPVEDRIDLDATRELHKKIRESGKAPLLVKDALEQLGFAAPTPADIKHVEQMRATGASICGNCLHYRYRAGQEALLNGGANAIMETLGQHAASLGDWQRYGICEAADQNLLVSFDAPGWRCPNYKPRKGKFGRMVGGVWSRITDI